MEKLRELFRLYYQKAATPEQRSELMQLVKDATPEQLLEVINENWEAGPGTAYPLSPEKADSILQYILQNTSEEQPAFSEEEQPAVRVHGATGWWRYAAAASVVLLLSFGAWFLIGNKKNHSTGQVTKRQEQPDITPGGYKARLTLADGSTIVLDTTAAGQVALQGKTSIINHNGHVTYQPGEATGTVAYNTLSTANGETYALTLADGSTVTLNSASSIRFPVSFAGAERKIEITGEAYCKVVRNPKQPFIVSVNGMEVRDLGTEFNINAYPDEAAVNTTLIEGAVKVSYGSGSAILAPGQQSRVTPAGQLQTLAHVNLDEVTGWKDGYFHFESADMKSILRQVARWYNIKVIYQGAVSGERFFCLISRHTPLSAVLKSLQANGVKFTIEGNNLYVISG